MYEEYYPGEFLIQERVIYYYNNDTAIDELEFEVTNLKTIFNYTGDSMDDPVKNIEIRGMT